MNKLNYRYKRNIRKNLSFYVSAIIMTILSIFIYVSILGTKEGLQGYMDDFVNRHPVEDAQFVISETLSDDETEYLEDTYSLNIENMRYVNCKESGFTVRLFDRSSDINTAEVYEGRDAEKDNEIVLSKGFALEHDLNIGSEITLGGKKFTVTGYFIRPDYVNMLETINGSFRDNQAFGIGMVSSTMFEEMGTVKSYYSVCFDDDNDIEFRRYMNDNYTLMNYTDRSINARIQTLYDKTDSYVVMAYFAFVLMLVLTTLLISMILSRKIAAEQPQIGTLKAMGFRNSELMKHYLILPTIAGLLGSIAGLVLCKAIIQPICEYYAGDYEPVPIDYDVPVIAVVLCMIVPTLFYTLFSSLSIRKILKKDVMDMINESDEGKSRTKKLLVDNEKMSFRRKFVIRNVFGNLGRTIIVFLGLTVGVYVMSLGYICDDSCKDFISDSIDNIGNYEYQYSLNTYMTEERKDCTCAVSASFEYPDTASAFSMMGINDSSLLELHDTDKNRVLINNDNDKWYISTMASIEYGIEAGDVFRFVSSTTLEEYEIKIDDIIENDAQKIVYSSQKNVCELLDVDESSYNTVFSLEEQDIDDAYLLTSITKKSFKAQIQAVVDDMASMVKSMIYVGALLCIISVYLTVNMLVDENKRNSVMLKVLGFRDREIRKLILNSYHILVIPAIIIGLVAGVATGKVLFVTMLDTYGCYIHSTIAPLSVILCVIITIVSYAVSLFLLNRKIRNIDVVKSLNAKGE